MFNRVFWLPCLLLPGVCLGLDSTPATQPAENTDLVAENETLRSRVAELEEQVRRLTDDNQHLMVLAGITPPADAAQAQQANIVTSTDPATHATTVSFKFERLRVEAGSRHEHWMRLAYVQPPDGSPPSVVDLIVLARLTPSIYRDLREGRLEVDGESLTLPVAAYDAQMRGRGGAAGQQRLYNERVTLAVPPQLLNRLATARDVGIRLRHVQLRLQPHQIAQFTAFQYRLQPEP